MANNYTSYTEDETIIINQERKSPTRRIKKTTVKLSEIVPAEDPLPEIKSPMTLNRFWRERLRQ